MGAQTRTRGTRWLGLTAALVLAAWLNGAGAQEPLQTPSLTSVCRQGWIHFDVRSGRIRVTGSRGVDRTLSQGGERLSIRIAGSQPVVAYELTTPTSRFRLDVSAGNLITLSRLPKNDRPEPVPVEFRQGPNAPVVVEVGPKGRQRAYQAESIWHLFLAEPAMAREHLAPLLRILLREWDFGKMADDIESILVQTAQSGAPPDQRVWAQWVQQLGDASFAKREAADRSLRESGRVVVTYLRQLDLGRLDAEQRYRVRRILHTLSDATHDELPPQLAAWLSGDASIWLALLSRSDASTRRAAWKRLEAMVGGPLAFDPGADEPTRQRQIDAIRAKISARP